MGASQNAEGACPQGADAVGGRLFKGFGNVRAPALDVVGFAQLVCKIEIKRHRQLPELLD